MYLFETSLTNIPQKKPPSTVATASSVQLIPFLQFSFSALASVLFSHERQSSAIETMARFKQFLYDKDHTIRNAQKCLFWNLLWI